MLRRDIADRLQILVVNRFRTKQLEREFTKAEIEYIWNDIYARLNRGNTEKEIEEFYKTVKWNEVLIYDSKAAERFGDLVDICSPQECADLFGKPVKDGEIIYYPKINKGVI